MKKIITIGIAICQFIILVADGQETKPGTLMKRQQFCSAEITLMDNSAGSFALGGFAGDSILVFPISTANNRLQILLDHERKIPAHSIRKDKIGVKKIKNSPDILSGNNDLNKQANNALAVNVQGTHAIDGIGNGLVALSEVVYDPLAFTITSVVLLPVIIPLAILSAKEKTYHINGQVKRLDRMKRRLTR